MRSKMKSFCEGCTELLIFALLLNCAERAQAADESMQSKDEKPKVMIAEKAPEKPAETPLAKFFEMTEIRHLPGQLNNVRVFNSNSPEMILEDGILLSTFPFDQMAHPECHLNYSFQGDFDLFAHHVTKAESDADERVLWLGFLVGNPSNKKVRVRVLSGASYLSQPDAPFAALADITLNNEGKVFAGPGDRVSDEVLRGAQPTFMPKSIDLAAGQTKLLLALPLPVRKLRPALNGRSVLLKLNSSGPVNAASLAKYVGPLQGETGPAESEWIEALNSFRLAKPRDKSPTEPFIGKGGIIFGRVAGVGLGNQWNAVASDAAALSPLRHLPQQPSAYLNMPGISGEPAKPRFAPLEGNSNGRITDLVDLASNTALVVTGGKKNKKSNSDAKPAAAAIGASNRDLTIPAPEKNISFPISTVERGTFGTRQIQSAPLLVSYADTAFLANGNYGITYKIDLPLHNPLQETVNVQILFKTPLKSDEAKLEFYEEPPSRAHFRGTVKVTAEGKTNYWHLVQKQGFDGSKLAELLMPAGSRKKVSIEFIYPPDATPPHVISILTLRKGESED